MTKNTKKIQTLKLESEIDSNLSGKFPNSFHLNYSYSLFMFVSNI
jgi:hypothetical protein